MMPSGSRTKKGFVLLIFAASLSGGKTRALLISPTQNALASGHRHADVFTDATVPRHEHRHAHRHGPDQREHSHSHDHLPIQVSAEGTIQAVCILATPDLRFLPRSLAMDRLPGSSFSDSVYRPPIPLS